MYLEHHLLDRLTGSVKCKTGDVRFVGQIDRKTPRLQSQLQIVTFFGIKKLIIIFFIIFHLGGQTFRRTAKIYLFTGQQRLDIGIFLVNFPNCILVVSGGCAVKYRYMAWERKKRNENQIEGEEEKKPLF